MTSAELRGQIVMITGAGRGLGRGIARAFAAWGAQLAVSDVDAASAAQTADEIEAAGGTAVAGQLDVTAETAVERYVDDIAADLGNINLLVNNAGVLSVAQTL